MRILIVGGGIAGLSTARALRLRGIESEIVERDASPRIAGAGVYLPGNGMAALRTLGLGEAVLAHGAVISRRRLLDDRGRLFVDFDEAGLWEGVAPPVALHRADLQDVLRAGAAGTRIRMGTTIVSLDDRGSAVQAVFTDGSEADYDLVVGADGVHSAVRALVFGGPEPRRVGQAGWRFVVEGHDEIDGWNGWIGRDRGFLALAIGGGRAYCYADVLSPDGRDPTGGDPRRLAAAFEAFAGPARSFLDAISSAADLWYGPVEEVAPTWSTGRVVLVGDAAHASSPNMAEGASLAMEDAIVLAEELSTRDSVETALAAFRTRREPRVSWVQETTHRRDRLRYAPPFVRRVAMRVAGDRIFRRHYRPLLAPP
ncbi:MAG TPA: FAD-dependent monooxygenase [Candidatus Limnocylindrales bacterium]|jgi:2-polyprenyl-6-methoxyphenol hydroxylase-like FAD-dependent oxidoreductase